MKLFDLDSKEFLAMLIYSQLISILFNDTQKKRYELTEQQINNTMAADAELSIRAAEIFIDFNENIRTE